MSTTLGLNFVDYRAYLQTFVTPHYLQAFGGDVDAVEIVISDLAALQELNTFYKSLSSKRLENFLDVMVLLDYNFEDGELLLDTRFRDLITQEANGKITFGEFEISKIIFIFVYI